MSGRVVHFEIPADDIERARSFYREAFGWQMQPMPEMEYTGITTTESDETGPTEPGAINGGLCSREDPITGPVVTIDVADIDQALTRVEQLGGKVAMPRQAVADMGFAAYFYDPDGNLMGLWQSAA